MSRKFVDCTMQDKEGARHCNFQRIQADPIRMPDLKVQGAKAAEAFNSDTFPAKLDNLRQQKDAKYWNIKNDKSTINMVPSFGGTRGNQTDNAWNSKLEYMTGDFLNREFQKREITPHFTPYKDNVPNKNYTYTGTRADDDFGLSQRLSIHKYKESERPAWSWTQVGPGLNKGYTNCGSEGFHPFWRSPVPTYEERRGKTRPEFDVRKHVMYGRMENMANATTNLMEQTKEIKPTAWQDDRYRFHGPNRNNQGERRRSAIVMNTDRKLKPNERYGTSRGADHQTKRDADHHNSRQRGNGLNNIGVMNPDGGQDAGQYIDHTTMKSQIMHNLRRNNLTQLPLGSYDRASGTLGAIDYNIANFEKDGAIKRRNVFLMESLRTGNVGMEVKDNKYLLPKDLAPSTKKQHILQLLRRGGVIDSQADNWYIEGTPPEPTLKQFLIYNLYTPAIDTQYSNVYNLPDAPDATIKQGYLRPSRGEQVTTKQYNVYQMPSAPQATIKQDYASRPRAMGQVATQGVGIAPMPDAPAPTKKQGFLRPTAPSSMITGVTAPNIATVQAPDMTRKDQVAASIGDFVRSGGDKSAQMSQPIIQLEADRSLEMRQSAPSASSVPIFDRTAPIMTQKPTMVSETSTQLADMRNQIGQTSTLGGVMARPVDSTPDFQQVKQVMQAQLPLMRQPLPQMEISAPVAPALRPEPSRTGPVAFDSDSGAAAAPIGSFRVQKKQMASAADDSGSSSGGGAMLLPRSFGASTLSSNKLSMPVMNTRLGF